MNRSRRRQQAGHLLVTPLFAPLIAGKLGAIMAIWTTAWDQIAQAKDEASSLPTIAILLSMASVGGMLMIWGVGRRLERRAEAVQPRTPLGKVLWGLALTVLVLTGLVVYGLLAFAALTFATLRYS